VQFYTELLCLCRGLPLDRSVRGAISNGRPYRDNYPAGGRSSLAKCTTFQEPYQLTHPRLVESAKFLPATKPTNHFMFNPRSLSSGKPFVRLHRTESLIVLYFRNVEYGVFKVLR
jgi:hypothetical protein